MGKYALIINGDTEPRHHDNVEMALARLKEDGYIVFVASTKMPMQTSSDRYIDPTYTDLNAFVDEIRQQTGSEDELVVYTTGHGTGNGFCLNNYCDTADTITKISDLPHKKMTVVMDQCFGGNFANRFLNKPNTLFISVGSFDEEVCCGEFAPKFWAKEVPDLNKDDVISFQERFANVNPSRLITSAPLFIPTQGHTENGKAPFEPVVQKVSNEDELNDQLSRLCEGQYAFVLFSAKWCGPCQEFKPAFAKMAGDSNGQYLFLLTENEDLAKKWGITGFPRVVITDANGNAHRVTNRDNIISEIKMITPSLINYARRLYLNTIEHPFFDDPSLYLVETISDTVKRQVAPFRAHILRENIQYGNKLLLREYMNGYSHVVPGFSKETAEFEANELSKLFVTEDSEVRAVALSLYCMLLLHVEPSQEKMFWIEQELESLSANSHPLIRESVLNAYDWLLYNKKLPAEDILATVEMARRSLDDGDSNVRFAAASLLAEAHKASKDILTHDDKLRSARIARNSGMGPNAILIYNTFLDELPPDEIAKGSKALFTAMAKYVCSSAIGEWNGVRDQDYLSTAKWFYEVINLNYFPNGVPYDAQKIFDQQLSHHFAKKTAQLKKQLHSGDLTSNYKAIYTYMSSLKEVPKTLSGLLNINLSVHPQGLSSKDHAIIAETAGALVKSNNPETVKGALDIYDFFIDGFPKEELKIGIKLLDKLSLFANRAGNSYYFEILDDNHYRMGDSICSVSTEDIAWLKKLANMGSDFTDEVRIRASKTAYELRKRCSECEGDTSYRDCT